MGLAGIAERGRGPGPNHQAAARVEVPPPEPVSTALRLMRMSPRRLAAAFAAPGLITMLLMVSGCAATGCTPPAGGRCAGPLPLPPDQLETPSNVLRAGVGVSPDERTIIVIVECGGRLVARESKHEVLLTWIASAVGAGAMSCAEVPLTAHLRQPLGSRPVIDSATGARLHPPVCHLGRPPSSTSGSSGSRFYVCT